jgi:hypothetical protein
MTEAMARGALSVQSVAHILDQAQRKADEPPSIEVVLPLDPKVRDLHIEPHSLAAYDALAASEATKEKSRKCPATDWRRRRSMKRAYTHDDVLHA